MSTKVPPGLPTLTKEFPNFDRTIIEMVYTQHKFNYEKAYFSLLEMIPDTDETIQAYTTQMSQEEIDDQYDQEMAAAMSESVKMEEVQHQQSSSSSKLESRNSLTDELKKEIDTGQIFMPDPPSLSETNKTKNTTQLGGSPRNLMGNKVNLKSAVTEVKRTFSDEIDAGLSIPLPKSSPGSPSLSRKSPNFGLKNSKNILEARKTSASIPSDHKATSKNQPINNDFLSTSSTGNKNYQIILLRGCSGSGKSTLAKEIFDEDTIQNKKVTICSADDYFIDENGVYKHNRNQLSEVHKKCQDKAKTAILEAISFKSEDLGNKTKYQGATIIIDNTNINYGDMQIYAVFAVKYDFQLILRRPNNPGFNNAKLCSNRNVHKVPLKHIKKQIDGYYSITADKLIELYCRHLLPSTDTRSSLNDGKRSYSHSRPKATQKYEENQMINKLSGVSLNDPKLPKEPELIGNSHDLHPPKSNLTSGPQPQKFKLTDKADLEKDVHASYIPEKIETNFMNVPIESSGYEPISEKQINFIEADVPKTMFTESNINDTGIAANPDPTTTTGEEVLIELSNRAIDNIFANFHQTNRKLITNPSIHPKSFAIPKNLALQLYQCWYRQAENIINNKEVDDFYDQMWRDCRYLPTSSVTPITDQMTPLDGVYSSASGLSTGPKPLKEIQAEERRAKISQEKQNLFLKNTKNQTISSKLVINRLVKVFKNLHSEEVCKTVLDSNQRDMKATITQLAEMLGTNEKFHQKQADNEIYTLWEEKRIMIDEKKLGRDFEEYLEITEDIELNGTNQTADYVEARLEADSHEKLHKYYLDKINSLSGNNPCHGAIRTNYSQAAQRHKRLMMQCNRYAVYILLSRRKLSSGPAKMDLHGLKANEVIEAVRNYFHPNNLDKIRNAGYRKVEIITGTGIGKTGSKGDLKRQVGNWLIQKNYKYEHEGCNEGSFIVRI